VHKQSPRSWAPLFKLSLEAFLSGVQSLAGCQSLDDLQRCHAKYLRAAQRYCLLGQDTLALLVHDALLRLLDCALHYCWLSAQLGKVAGGAAAGEAARQGPAAVSWAAGELLRGGSMGGWRCRRSGWPG
jgi:hypothetical protein